MPSQLQESVMRGWRRTIVTLALTAALAPEAGAQSYFGLGGGWTAPVGPASRSLASGFNALALIGFGAPNIPLGVRFDGQFNRFRFKGDGPYQNLWAGTANLVAPLSQGVIVPYLIGGVGYYAIQNPSAPTNPVTDLPCHSPGCTPLSPSQSPYPTKGQGAFGVNGGLGVRTWGTGRLGIFLEARYHYVWSHSPPEPVVPITLGVTF
jgi:hypothetical protein